MIIIMGIIVIVFIILLVSFPHVLIAIKKFIEEAREEHKKQEADLDRKVLHTEVESIEKAQR